MKSSGKFIRMMMLVALEGLSLNISRSSNIFQMKTNACAVYSEKVQTSSRSGTSPAVQRVKCVPHVPTRITHYNPPSAGGCWSEADRMWDI